MTRRVSSLIGFSCARATFEPVSGSTERRSSTEAAARDAGLGRLKRLTQIAAASAAALTGVFSGLAANAFPGRTVHRIVRGNRAVPEIPMPVSASERSRPGHVRHRRPSVRPPARTRAVAPEATPTDVPAPAPAPLVQPPAQPPASVQAPPVVVSGGS